MQKSVVETFLGAIVLIITAALLIYSYIGYQNQKVEGYELLARFDRVDGLVEGSDVTIGGIKVGNLSKLSLLPNTYEAKGILTIDKDVKIPRDSIASVVSSSLLGGKYLSLSPGVEDEFLTPGDEISHTQSSLILESLIGQLIFNTGKKSEKD